MCAKRKIIDGEFPRDSVALESNNFVRFSHDVLNKKDESDLTHKIQTNWTEKRASSAATGFDDTHPSQCSFDRVSSNNDTISRVGCPELE